VRITGRFQLMIHRVGMRRVCILYEPFTFHYKLSRYTAALNRVFKILRTPGKISDIRSQLCIKKVYFFLASVVFLNGNRIDRAKTGIQNGPLTYQKPPPIVYSIHPPDPQSKQLQIGRFYPVQNLRNPIKSLKQELLKNTPKKPA